MWRPTPNFVAALVGLLMAAVCLAALIYANA